MRGQSRWAGTVVGVFMGVLLSAAGLLAGSLEPSGGPNMVTLEQIYDRLNAGTAGTKGTKFIEPSSGPAGTGHTLDEIMGKLPALDNGNGAGLANVAAGKTYWGLTKFDRFCLYCPCTIGIIRTLAVGGRRCVHSRPVE